MPTAPKKLKGVVLEAGHRHLVEHLPVGAAIGALLRGRLALHPVAAVGAGPVEGLRLPLQVSLLIAHASSFGRLTRLRLPKEGNGYCAGARLSTPAIGRTSPALTNDPLPANTKRARGFPPTALVLLSIGSVQW